MRLGGKQPQNWLLWDIWEYFFAEHFIQRLDFPAGPKKNGGKKKDFTEKNQDFTKKKVDFIKKKKDFTEKNWDFTKKKWDFTKKNWDLTQKKKGFHQEQSPCEGFGAGRG